MCLKRSCKVWLMCVLFLIAAGFIFGGTAFADEPAHFGTLEGNPRDAFWTIYLSEAKSGEADLEAGDEIAIFDGDVMVGAFTLTEVLSDKKKLENDLKAWTKLDDDQEGYTAGNPYTFKCWDASGEAESVCDATLASSEDAYEGNIFPEDKHPYSIVSLVCDGASRKTVDINGDEAVDMADVILGLKLLTGLEGSGSSFNLDASLDGDKPRIGMKEVVYVLQDIAEAK